MPRSIIQPVQQPNTASANRGGREKCPLLLKADTRTQLRSDFFNTLG